ncbi:MAG: hypothetical protein IPG04_06940 [Polyangiaceae bacterium]|nr:hypothetical protein [Polyangiaceae bacterium]
MDLLVRTAQRCARARVIAPLLVVLATACGGEKRQDCDALMAVVNEGFAQLENGRQQQKNDPTQTVELRAIADLVDKTANKASGLSAATPEVKSMAGRYAAMLKEVAKSSREIADAHEANDLARVEKGRMALNAALKNEDGIIHDLNTFCSR